MQSVLWGGQAGSRVATLSLLMFSSDTLLHGMSSAPALRATYHHRAKQA